MSIQDIRDSFDNSDGKVFNFMSCLSPYKRYAIRR